MNERILIVDDEKGIVDMLKSYFEKRFFWSIRPAAARRHCGRCHIARI